MQWRRIKSPDHDLIHAINNNYSTPSYSPSTYLPCAWSHIPSLPTPRHTAYWYLVFFFGDSRCLPVAPLIPYVPTVSSKVVARTPVLCLVLVVTRTHNMFIQELA